MVRIRAAALAAIPLLAISLAGCVSQSQYDALAQINKDLETKNAALQQHANGATGIGGSVLVAQNPADHHIFLSAFTGERELHAGSGVLTAPTPRGDIRVMDPAAFQARFGIDAPDCAAGARLAAVRFTVRERKVLHGGLAAGGIAFTEHMGQTIVAPAAALGATLVFEDPDFGS